MRSDNGDHGYRPDIGNSAKLESEATYLWLDLDRFRERERDLLWDLDLDRLLLSALSANSVDRNSQFVLQKKNCSMVKEVSLHYFRIIEVNTKNKRKFWIFFSQKISIKKGLFFYLAQWQL